MQLTTTLPSTASVAEAVNVSPAPSGPVASTFVFEGTVMVGAVVSLTVTVKLLAPTFARLSLAVQVTVVAPSGNVAPLAGVQLTATGPSIASVADALNVNTAPAGPVASTLAFAGTVTIGAPVSLTVTVNEAEPVLPCASVAVQVTTVAPIGNVEPLAGVQLAAITPSMLSVAETPNANTAPVGAVASSFVLPGTLRTGGVVSIRTTDTVNVPVAVLPAPSVAEHLTVVVPIGKREPLGDTQVTGCWLDAACSVNAWMSGRLPSPWCWAR